MNIKNKLIKEYPLTRKVECPFECFEVIKRRYVIFFNKNIKRKDMEPLLDVFNNAIKNNSSKVKTLIIVGYTDEQFNKQDLLFFNGVDTFVVYYLKNEINNEIYFNDQKVFWFSVDWKKIIIKFNKILNS